jgi:hypothetical protein
MTPPPPDHTVHERSLTVLSEVSRTLGGLLADKEAMIHVMDGLRAAHRAQFDKYKANRDDSNPDFLFIVPVRVFLRGRWRYVRFSVNDTTSPDHFFVEAVSMSG